LFSFILIPVLILVGRFIYSLPLLQARFGFVGDGAVVGGVRINTAGRFNIWKLLLERASDSPWIGHGIGAAEDLVIGYFGTVAQPHNDFLRIYFDLGIVALFLWIFMCIRIGMKGFRSKSSSHMINLNFKFKYVLLFQLSVFMTTDNPLVYPFYVLPVFYLLGRCSALVTPKLISIE
jgi:O-antigen ligase